MPGDLNLLPTLWLVAMGIADLRKLMTPSSELSKTHRALDAKRKDSQPIRETIRRISEKAAEQVLKMRDMAPDDWEESVAVILCREELVDLLESSIVRALRRRPTHSGL